MTKEEKNSFETLTKEVRYSINQNSKGTDRILRQLETSNTIKMMEMSNATGRPINNIMDEVIKNNDLYEAKLKAHALGVIVNNKNKEGN